MVLHPFENGVDRFLAVHIVPESVGQAIGFINEKNAVECRRYYFVGLDGGLTQVTAHKVVAVSLDDLRGFEL